jgi:hypothetical protein
MTPIKRPATVLDAVLIAENLREQDRREVQASSGPNIREALVDSVVGSKESFVWTLDGKPICIAGVANAGLPGPNSGAGIPWMLGTPEMMGYSKMLVKDARIYIEKKLEEFTCLFNFVHAENSVSIGWLKRLGFKLGERIEEYGAGKQPFILFYRYK